MKIKQTVFLAAFFVCVSFTLVSHAEARLQKVILTKATGSVEIISKGFASGMPAAEGTFLKEGDSIRTGGDGFAELFFEKAGVVQVQSDSFMTIEMAQVKNGRSDTTTFVKQGNIKAMVRRLAANQSAFRTRTPVAVAAVRGTTYIVSVTIDGQTTIYVIEGSVNVSTLLNQLGVTLGSGQSTTVGPGGAAGTVKTTRDETLDIEHIDIDFGSSPGFTPPVVESRNIDPTATQGDSETEEGQQSCQSAC